MSNKQNFNLQSNSKLAKIFKRRRPCSVLANNQSIWAFELAFLLSGCDIHLVQFQINVQQSHTHTKHFISHPTFSFFLDIHKRTQTLVSSFYFLFHHHFHLSFELHFILKNNKRLTPSPNSILRKWMKKGNTVKFMIVVDANGD